MSSVDKSLFPLPYLDKAEQVFLRPAPRYSWREIVRGTDVRSPSGGTRRMFAVAPNTFRGFHRIDKTRPGAKDVFLDYFVSEQARLADALAGVHNRDDLHRTSNSICAAVRAGLGNCDPRQLASFNKLRKPVDLFLEHLVAMAVELDRLRERLVPLQFLPLDSQILGHPGLFSQEELARQRLSRKSTYQEITAEQTYLHLQDLLARKAAALSAGLGRPFHVVYFDLLWNERFRRWGGNLFETNP